MEYLKLGSTASVFYDPTTQILIRTHEVLALSHFPKSKKMGLAKRSGHITAATKDEYEAYLATLSEKEKAKLPTTAPAKPKKPAKPAEDTYDYNPDLLKLTPDEFRERVAEEGFLDDDIKKFDGLTNIKEMIKLFDIVNEEYK